MTQSASKDSYNCILVTVDLNEDAKKLIRKAVNIQKSPSSRIVVLHVVKPKEAYIGFEQYVDLNSVHQDIVQKAQEALVTTCQEFSIPEADQLLVVGYPKRRILTCAKDLQADLIIIGKHTSNNEVQKILGSTTDTILQQSGCDVLTVLCQEESTNIEPL